MIINSTFCDVFVEPKDEKGATIVQHYMKWLEEVDPVQVSNLANEKFRTKFIRNIDHYIRDSHHKHFGIDNDDIVHQCEYFHVMDDHTKIPVLLQILNWQHEAVRDSF